MASVPAGGPSTVNGVLYQLLYSLLTLGGFRAVAHRLEEGTLEEVTMVLEPSAGGDQQAHYLGKRIVTQLKARSTGGSWSLKEVICSVLPDLYRAVDRDRPETEYQFVTEGEQGRWTQVEEIYHNLPEAPPSGFCQDALDDEKEIKFGRAQPTDGSADSFWRAGPYTARRLFSRVVETLRERAEVAAESYHETCRKTWALLRGYRFVGGMTHEALRDELDRWLLARIGSSDRLSEKRDHLLLELGRQACIGNVCIDAKTFLASHGLANTPLTEWAQLSRRAHEHLRGVLRRKRAGLSEDVRPHLTNDICANWTKHSPILVLTGASGSGKTWHGYRSLLAATEGGDVAILVDSHGDADRDLMEAANTFWHRIMGVDEAPPLSRLRARLERLSPANLSRRLTLLVDNVSSPEEARRFLNENWEALEVRLAITCPQSVAEALRPFIGDRGRVVQISDYELTELQTFLTRVVGVPWEYVPFDVQATIRRPLLADLFGDIVAEDGLQPRNEYDLYQRAWQLLRRRGVGPFDLDGLRRAALGLLATARYPWAICDLRASDLDSEAVDRLLDAGWLRETTGGEFEVWHDRLLNWTVAEAFAKELINNPEDPESHLQAIAVLLKEPTARCGRMLGYVPLDVMWILSKDHNDLFSRLILTCEGALGWRATEILHKELLPTLGSRAVPLLLSRLRTTAESGPSFLVSNIISGLVATGDEGICGHAIELLDSQIARVCRAGVRLITAMPAADALDRLWTIHVDGVRNPEPYLWEQTASWTLYEDTFTALKACVRRNLPWLERTIRDADATAVPVHDLAYLVAAIGDAGIWSRCKEALLSKVDEAHERAIASCVLAFRDRDALEWLEARVDKTKDFVGPVSLRALTVIEPRRALALLDRLDDGALYISRRWCFSELHLRLPDEVMAHFGKTLRTHNRPWRYALVLQEREDLIDAASFDFFLDRLAELLASSVAAGRTREVSADCRTGLAFINAVSRPELLDRLRCRRGTALEQNLADWAVILGPQLGEWKVPDKFDALDALTRIGGDAFNRVLNLWIEHAGWGGRMHAVQMAQRRASPRTVELLTELSEAVDVESDEHQAALGGYATAALAVHGVWPAVFRYYLRVGLQSLNVVKECCPVIAPPLDDTTLAEALVEFRGETGPTPGSVLCIGIASRRDLLPEVRAALRGAQPGSDLAGACLLALQWLEDTDPKVVSAITPHLASHNYHARNALLGNGSPAAEAELARDLQARPSLQLAARLAKNPRHRHQAIVAIRRLISDAPQSRSSLHELVAYLDPDLLSHVAESTDVFAVAEEVGYSPYERIRVRGEKPAALHIIGARQPDAAVRMALARLRHPDTPDAELYVPVVGKHARGNRAAILLDALSVESPTRVVHAIGREFGSRGATATVLEWLKSPTAEQRLVACRVAGFLPCTDELDAELRARADDVDRHIAAAAIDAHDRFKCGRTAEELIRTLTQETESTHRWVLLDSLVSVADPEGGGSLTPWWQAIRPYLTPALARHLTLKVKDRRKKLRETFDRDDRQR
jgi:hypothetical protein